jgi:hypothetical protein
MTTHNPLPRGHYRLPVVDIADVGFYPSALSSSVTRPVPTGRWNEPATTLQQARPRAPFGNRDSYSSDSPSPLRFKHLDTNQAPPNHRRQQSTFPD